MAGVMVVTGGSRGIGAAVARLAAARGYRVCVNYQRAVDRAEALVAEIRAAGGEAHAVQADVADEADVERLFTTVDERLGRVEVLVNNAGIDHVCAFADLAAEDLDRVLAVNVRGPMLCARAAVWRMSTVRGGVGGVIVNVSSISALYGGLPRDVVYAASKGALDAFTMGLAREVASEGIRVCGVRPGLTYTEMWESDIGAEAATRMAATGVPLGRIGRPEEIAAGVLWLASPEASYVTGEMVNVSGGRELNVRSG